MRSLRRLAAPHPLPSGVATVAVQAPGVLSDAEIAALGVALPEGLRRAAPRRRTEWALGRYCARLAGAAVGGFPAGACGSGPDRAPLWPAGFIGSITHKDDFVAAAVAPSDRVLGLGIDSEAPLDDATFAETKDEIGAAAEWQLGAAAGADLARWFPALLFSAKESLYKCLRPRAGRFFGFHDARLVALDAATGRFVLELAATLAPDLTAGRRLGGNFRIDGQRVHTAMVWHAKDDGR